MSTRPQIKTFIRLACAYDQVRSDQNLAQLQRQIQILSVVNDVSIFEPSSTETYEFYVCLEQLLKNKDAKALSWKVINLLSNLCRSPTIKVALRDTLLFVPVLTDYITTFDLSDDKRLKALQLLRDVSFGIKVGRREPWLMDLTNYLMTAIVGRVNKIYEVALSILANIARNNALIQVKLLESPLKKSLLNVITQLQGCSFETQIFAAEILFHLSSDQYLPGVNEAHHSLDIIFFMVTDGLTNKDEVKVQLGSDILESLLQREHINSAAAEYPDLLNRCQGLLDGIEPGTSSKVVGTLFLFFTVVLRLKHTVLDQILNSLYTAISPWLLNSTCYGAVKAAYCMLDFLTVERHKSHLLGFVDVAKTFLSDEQSINSIASENCWTWLHCLLLFIESLCLKDSSICQKLVTTLQPANFSAILDILLGVEKEDATLVNGTVPLSGSTVEQSLGKGTEKEFGASNLSGTSTSGDNLLRPESALLVLSCTKHLSAVKSEFLMEHSRMLNNLKVMKCIVMCERSASPSLVSKVV